ncbi:hypothetical protein Tco_0986112 [Tanacetum coccineum]
MHGHGHPELAKKLNDKIPKTVDEMFERVRAFIRGEVVAGSAEMARPSQWDKGNGSQHQRLLSVKKANRGSCGLGEVGSSGEGHLLEQLEERESDLTDELTFLAIPQNQLTDEPIILEGMIKGHQVRRILVDGGSLSKINYEHCFKSLIINIRSRLRRCRTPLVGLSGETYHPLGVIDLRVTMGKARRNKTVLMEFAIIKCHSPYNAIIRRTKMRILGVVSSSIHSMMKFPTNQGVVMMETSREALWECRQLEKVQGQWKEV